MILGKLFFMEKMRMGIQFILRKEKVKTHCYLLLKILILILEDKENQSKEKIIFSNTSPTVPIAMSLGGLFFLERFKNRFLSACHIAYSRR